MSEKSAGKTRVRWEAFGAIVTGVLLFLLAAAGGFVWGGLVVRVETGGAQILVSALGIGLLAVGVLSLSDRQGRERARPAVRRLKGDARLYQVKMLRPRRYQRRMRVEGWYAHQPPDEALRLFTVREDGRFRPQSIAEIDEGEQHWSGEVDLGPGPSYAVYVVAALVEGAGAVLWDYYFQVGSQTDWEPVDGQFSDCAMECDRFLVEGVIHD